MHTYLAPLADRGGDDIPGVTLTGIAVGVLLLIAAIRGLFGKGK